MSSPATQADVSAATNNVTSSRHFDELMASQSAQSAGFAASQCAQTTDLGSQTAHAERYVQRAVIDSKDSVKDAAERSAIHLQDSVLASKDSIKDSAERNVIQTRDSVERNADWTNSNIKDVGIAIERVGAQGVRATDLNGAAVGTAVERTGFNIAERVNSTAMENRIVSDNKSGELKHEIFMSKYDTSVHLNGLQKDLYKNKYASLKQFSHMHKDNSEYRHHSATETSQYRYHAARDLEHHFKDTAKDAAELKYLALQSQGVLQLQASENSAKSALQICTLENSLAKQAAENFQVLKFQSLENKCELQSKIDECCCELKGKISASEKTVTEAISQTENSRLRDTIRSLETQNIIFQSTQSRP